MCGDEGIIEIAETDQAGVSQAPRSPAIRAVVCSGVPGGGAEGVRARWRGALLGSSQPGELLIEPCDGLGGRFFGDGSGRWRWRQQGAARTLVSCMGTASAGAYTAELLWRLVKQYVGVCGHSVLRAPHSFALLARHKQVESGLRLQNEAMNRRCPAAPAGRVARQPPHGSNSQEPRTGGKDARKIRRKNERTCCVGPTEG